ncbi:MAG TPA: phosphatase PAP2 family protein [Bacteroidia bacterium]|nr:phosphatase PAP2 family protein [Bacteroidia bacterium]HNU34358.1 phosphatase PAP2 family protein [Bacteroidia bacterium]
MFEKIEEFDVMLFLFLNSHHNPFFDSFFYFITNRFALIPFYLILLFLVVKTFKTNTWKILLAAALLILCSDQLSVLLKNTFERYRPCHNSEIQSLIHLVNNKCGGLYGFVSSHATNSMAISVFLFLLLKNKYSKIGYLLFAYTLLVSYSRIYLGLHYPLDMMGGWVIGFILGISFAFLIKSKINLLESNV